MICSACFLSWASSSCFSLCHSPYVDSVGDDSWLLVVDILDTASAYDGTRYDAGSSFKVVSSKVIWLIFVTEDNKDPYESASDSESWYSRIFFEDIVGEGYVFGALSRMLGGICAVTFFHSFVRLR